MVKICFKCNTEKGLEHFYRHNQMSDGFLGKCKECSKLDSKSCRQEKIGYYRLYDKKRYHTSEKRKSQCSSSKQLNKKTYPEIKKYQTAVTNAVRDKRIIKSSTCELCFCENKRIHGHHIDYKQELNVIWLCPKCHSKVHMYENLVKERFGYNNILK